MRRVIPNILTFGRLVLTIIFLIMLLYWHYVDNPKRLFDAALIVFIIAGLTDVIDGEIARRLGVAGKFGRIVDPLFDKILVCGSFVCFAIIGQPRFFGLSGPPLAVINWTVAAVIILREFYVTVLRHIAEAKGISFAATAGGKIKMFVQSFAIGSAVVVSAHFPSSYRLHWLLVIIYVLMLIITIASGLSATRRTGWQDLKKGSSTPSG